MVKKQRRGRGRSNVPTGEEITVELTGFALQGDALGHVDGKTVSASFGIPGETVRIDIREDTPQSVAGDVVEVVNASPDRVTPRCPHFGECGGCQLQHIAYERQLDLKRNVVVERMARIGNLLDPPVLAALPAPDPWHYRNHARFSVTRDGQAGFTYRNSRKFIPIDECFIVHPWINQARRALEAAAAGSHQLAVRYGVYSGDHLIQPAMDSDGTGYETGQREYTERLYGVPFRVAASSFFQVNTPQAERMVDLVREGLDLRGTDVVVDAYAGVGTFAVLLAPFVRKIIAIEESHSAIVDAQSNTNGASHIELVEAKTEIALGEIAEAVDSVILDPPRAGCDERVLDALARLQPRRISYVSCDPETQARDLHALTLRGFRLLSLQPVDMFPQTHHIEAVATLAPMTETDLLLASTSPRRRQLLPALGMPFQTIVPAVDESQITAEGSPEEQAVTIAITKAYSIAQQAQTGSVVGADTIVVLDDEVLGKPQDAEEALSMLRRLRGREHQVITGIAVVGAQGSRMAMDAIITTVRMRDYSDAEMETYVASGEPMDKAGAYAIQDPTFHPVESIDGCPTNVIGLPLCGMADLLERTRVRPRTPGQRATESAHVLCHRVGLPLE